MISGISARSEVAFRIIDRGFTAERFLEFLTALIDAAPRKILLIVDHLRFHKAAAATARLEDKTNQPFYPRYAPESNPDEYLNSDVKNLLRLAAVSENREQLMEPAMTFMNRLQTWPERVRSYFQHPAAQYTAQPIDGPGQ